MEQYIKNFGDITYLSELTPPKAGLIRANNLHFLQSRKLCAH